MAEKLNDGAEAAELLRAIARDDQVREDSRAELLEIADAIEAGDPGEAADALADLKAMRESGELREEANDRYAAATHALQAVAGDAAASSDADDIGPGAAPSSTEAADLERKAPARRRTTRTARKGGAKRTAAKSAAKPDRGEQ